MTEMASLWKERAGTAIRSLLVSCLIERKVKAIQKFKYALPTPPSSTCQWHELGTGKTELDKTVRNSVGRGEGH